MLPAGGARATMIGPTAVVARRGGGSSPRDYPNTRPHGAGVLLAGDAS